MLPYAQRLWHPAHLQHCANPHMRGQTRRIASENRYIAGGGYCQSQQQLDGCRLACPIWSQQCHKFSWPRVKVEVRKCQHLSENFADAIHLCYLLCVCCRLSVLRQQLWSCHNSFSFLSNASACSGSVANGNQ